MDEKRVSITINFVIHFKICTGFFSPFFLVKSDMICQLATQIESQPAPNQANQAKTRSFLSKITSRCKPKPAAVNRDSNLESELRQYVNHFDNSIGAYNDEDIDPLQYFKVFQWQIFLYRIIGKI